MIALKKNVGVVAAGPGQFGPAVCPGPDRLFSCLPRPGSASLHSDHWRRRWVAGQMVGWTGVPKHFRLVGRQPGKRGHPDFSDRRPGRLRTAPGRPSNLAGLPHPLFDPADGRSGVGFARHNEAILRPRDSLVHRTLGARRVSRQWSVSLLYSANAFSNSPGWHCINRQRLRSPVSSAPERTGSVGGGCRKSGRRR